MKRSFNFLGWLAISLWFVPVALSQDLQTSEQQQLCHEDISRLGMTRWAALDKLCRATADTGLFSGAVLVADSGEIIYRKAFGMANREWKILNTTDTKFRLASVSKPFCSMLIMQLVQEGKIKLDDKITDYLSYYRNDTGDRITIHHLLSHQSGIKDFTASFDYRGTISRSSFGKDEFIKLHLQWRFN